MTNKNEFFDRVIKKYDDLSEDQLRAALFGVTAMYASDKARALPQSERKGRSEEEFLIVLGEVIAKSAVSHAIKLTNEYEEYNKQAEK